MNKFKTTLGVLALSAVFFGTTGCSLMHKEVSTSVKPKAQNQSSSQKKYMPTAKELIEDTKGTKGYKTYWGRAQISESKDIISQYQLQFAAKPLGLHVEMYGSKGRTAIWSFNKKIKYMIVKDELYKVNDERALNKAYRKLGHAGKDMAQVSAEEYIKDINKKDFKNLDWKVSDDKNNYILTLAGDNKHNDLIQKVFGKAEDVNYSKSDLSGKITDLSVQIIISKEDSKIVETHLDYKVKNGSHTYHVQEMMQFNKLKKVLPPKIDKQQDSDDDSTDA